MSPPTPPRSPADAPRVPSGFELSIVPPKGEPRRQTLLVGRDYVVGRGERTDMRIDGDPAVSREHARLRVRDGAVDVERHAAASNPLFHEGSEVERCTLGDGESLVVGATLLRFARLDPSGSEDDASPVEEVAFDPQELRHVRFKNADDRIEVLSHLPDVIWGARTEGEFHQRLLNLILAGVAHADAAAIVAPDEHGEGIRTLHWERRRETAGDFRPSARLVREAVRTRKKTVLRIWESTPSARARGLGNEDYTAVAEFDWAFCTPVFERPDRGWGLYVAGSLDGLEAVDARNRSVLLHGDVKFTELVAQIINAVKRLGDLERQQAGLRQFFAPAVLSALADDPELLEPREAEVTVMFCDLRGFSRKAEEAGDDLLGLLDRVSHALEVMNREIQLSGGVTADFLGDAALGFWGWPLKSDEAPLNACRAALAIRRAFAEAEGRDGHPLANFRTGIGIAHGRAVAGKIGTTDQVKVTVFGPVVNLASRLENMTKQLRVPVVLDDRTAGLVRGRLPAETGRLRHLGRVLPYGLETAVDVSELLPPVSELPELRDEHVACYERAVVHFTEGRWEEAYEELHGVPANDRAQDFLTMRITQRNRVPPDDWDGVVRLPRK
jgi:adenylate cyclase